jgi:hypothetical protein
MKEGNPLKTQTKYEEMFLNEFRPQSTEGNSISMRWKDLISTELF